MTCTNLLAFTLKRHRALNAAKPLTFVVLLFVFAVAAQAQIRVSPTGVNVSTQTPTTAFLTFGNLNNQIPAEAEWCGDIIPATPDIGFKCNPASIFGVIPARYDRTTASGTAAYTDIMTLPASVARRAYQAAAAGANSSFFFVRRFISTVGGRDEFVPVVCRTAGGMAGSPFSITSVEIGFAGIDKPIVFAREGEKLPQLHAVIEYTGTGRLKGRWEVVLPGEDPPSAFDLLTESTLPIEKRGTQRHYTQLSTFNVFLPPNGTYTLDGPGSSQLPLKLDGEYQLLLRIESSETDATSSDLASVGAGPEVVYSGAVAGFPMPVLHYFVGAGTGSPTAVITQLAPSAGAILRSADRLNFAWMDIAGAALYRLEISNGTDKQILSALIPAGVNFYQAPPWLKDRVDAGSVNWRVIALDKTGNKIGESETRMFKFSKGEEKSN